MWSQKNTNGHTSHTTLHTITITQTQTQTRTQTQHYLQPASFVSCKCMLIFTVYTCHSHNDLIQLISHHITYDTQIQTDSCSYKHTLLTCWSVLGYSHKNHQNNYTIQSVGHTIKLTISHHKDSCSRIKHNRNRSHTILTYCSVARCKCMCMDIHSVHMCTNVCVCVYQSQSQSQWSSKSVNHSHQT